MDFYTTLASWVGWPALVALLLISVGFGAWLLVQHISTLKNEVSSLERKLNDCNEYRPDILVERLAKRHAMLTEELERTAQESERDAFRIGELQQQLESTNAEVETTRSELESALERLSEFELPREGRVIPGLARHILSTTEQNGEFYIPVGVWGNTGPDSIRKGPYNFELVYPGMHKTYVEVLNADNARIGLVENPFLGIYSRDYAETVAEILRWAARGEPNRVVEPPYSEGLSPRSSTFHAASPINRSVFYIAVPTKEDPDAFLSELENNAT